jgi:hypothetical protein
VNFNSSATFFLGVLALPLGGFFFGICFSLIHLAVEGKTNTYLDDPIGLGIYFAIFSAISIFAFLLFPLSVLTTFLLRRFLLKSTRLG